MQMLSVDQLEGRTLGEYQIERLLGHGQLGVAYIAQQPSQGRPVMITTFNSAEASSAREYDQFATHFAQESMNEWIIYPSIKNSKRYALGSPDGRELDRGEAIEILLGGFRIPGFIEYSANGDYFMAMTGQSICGLYARMKVYLAQAQVAVPCGAGAPGY